VIVPSVVVWLVGVEIVGVGRQVEGIEVRQLSSATRTLENAAILSKMRDALEETRSPSPSPRSARFRPWW
jgi:hypothetical protein